MNGTTPKIISKYHRLRLTDILKKLIESLPFSNLIETQVGNYVYSANGNILIGTMYYPVKILIKHKDNITATIKTYDKSIQVMSNFENENDCDEIVKIVKTSIKKCLN